jgi:predicted enzyme related to lactoylglutathione lyase
MEEGSMPSPVSFGAVVFAKDVPRVARFYESLVPMRVVHKADDHIVLETGPVQLVVHGISARIAKKIAIEQPPRAREETALKLFFPVASLAAAREQAGPLGGRLAPAEREWEARGFRACDGVDPEGNVVQFRVPVS